MNLAAATFEAPHKEPGKLVRLACRRVGKHAHSPWRIVANVPVNQWLDGKIGNEISNRYSAWLLYWAPRYMVFPWQSIARLGRIESRAMVVAQDATHARNGIIEAVDVAELAPKWRWRLRHVPLFAGYPMDNYWRTLWNVLAKKANGKSWYLISKFRLSPLSAAQPDL